MGRQMMAYPRFTPRISRRLRAWSLSSAVSLAAARMDGLTGTDVGTGASPPRFRILTLHATGIAGHCSHVTPNPR